MDNLLYARWQMAFTLGFHIILACFGVGMPLLMCAAEGLALKTGDVGWRTLAKRWSHVFAVLFAVGAVSGTVLSFELGLLWPTFMGKFGAVIGLAFTLEAFAFFLEAIFVGIYLYGWDKLSPRAHFFAGLPIVVSGAASAFFVVTANSWMNVPGGFKLDEQGKLIEAQPLVALLNPATGPQTTHMILSAYIVCGFCVAAFYAVAILRGKDTTYHRRALMLGALLGVFAAPPQFVVGDWAAKTVAATQPIKLAAMEGQYETERHAPLRIGGFPDDATRTTRYAIEIPGMLSWLGYGNVDAEVRGLNSFPDDDRPPTAVVHFAFQAMVGVGSLLLLYAGWVAYSLIRFKTMPQGKLFLWAMATAGPLAVVALEAGWIVTEVGRQPWIVHGVMRTRDAVTQASGIGYVFGMTLGIYAILAGGAIAVLRILARKPLPELLRKEHS